MAKYFDIALDKSARIELIKYLTRSEHRILLMTGYRRTKNYYNFPENIKYLPSVKIKGTHFLTLIIAMFFNTIIRLINWHPDIIICCPLSVLAVFPISIFAKILKWKTKFVMDIRSIPVEVKGLSGKLGEVIFKVGVYLAKYFFNGITVISPFMKKYISTKCRISEKKIGVWSSGVNIEHFNPDRLDQNKIKILRKKTGLDNKFVVMYHGVLTPNRGLQEATDAMSLLRNSYPDIIFVIIGDGITRPLLQKMIDKYKLKNVVLLPAVSYKEIPYYIALCNVGILPFPKLIWWRVSSPLKLMEYLAMQKPVIVTDIEAHRDVLGKNSCGFFISGNNPMRISSMITYLYTQRNKLSLMGEKARDVVSNHYTWDSQVSNLLGFLCSLN